MFKLNNRGFTLVELMIAMALFSFILLFAVNAFIQVNKIYVKGVTTKRMNDQASAIMGDLAKTLPQVRTLSFKCSNNPSCTATTGDNGDYRLCLDDLHVVYSWTIGLSSVLQKSSGTCDDDTLGNTQNLIDSNTSVRAFDVTSVTDIGDSNAYKIDLVLSTQRSDQLIDTDPNGSGPDNPIYTRCTGQVSDQYCAVVHLSTIIRLSN